MSRRGRPSTYSQETADIICTRLVEGESLRSICRDPEMPALSSVTKWLRLHEDFAAQYTRAREDQADTLADEILEIADNARNDWMEKQDDGGGAAYILNGEHVQRTRLRVEARKWMAGKMRPKVYGDKVEHDHKGQVVVIKPESSDL